MQDTGMLNRYATYAYAAGTVRRSNRSGALGGLASTTLLTRYLPT